MKTILLAGGQSRRVKPIADKNFVRICGKFLIEWQLIALKKADFKDIVIIGNASNIEQLSALTIEGIELTVVEQLDLDGGMSAAMAAAKDLLIEEDQIMVVSSNDVVESSCWVSVAEWINKNPHADGAVVACNVSGYFPGGYLCVDDNGFVQSIVEKPGEGNEPSDLVNLVIHIHRDVKALYDVLESVSSDQDNIYELALQQFFDEQKKYSIIMYDGFWQAVKYPWHLLKLNKFYLEQLERSISSDAHVADTVVINGNVVIESGVRVFDHVVINGPAYIGKNSILGNFTLLRGSSLGEGCVLGSFTEIARSLLQDAVWTHKNYVGDSIIGSNVSFGSGTVTGNLRLDEGDISVLIQDKKLSSQGNKLGIITGDNIRVGVNTSFMPGVKIGANSMLGANLNITQDIPHDSYVRSRKNCGLDLLHNVKKIGRRS